MKQHQFKLVTHDLCPYVQRSIITLEEKSIDYSRVDINLANKPAWFEQKSPMGKVPVLLVDEKPALFESAVICEYLDERTAGSLHPVDNFEKALHRSWIEFGSSILVKIASLYNAKGEAEFNTIHREIQNKFGFIERELKEAPFFAGAEFHMIDAVYSPIFRYFDAFDTFIDLQTLDEFTKCKRWSNALKNRKSVQKAVSKDYAARLREFLINRESYMSQLVFNAMSPSAEIEQRSNNPKLCS